LVGQPDAAVGQGVGDDAVFVGVFGAGQLVAVADPHHQGASGQGAEIDTDGVLLAGHGVSWGCAVLSRMISSGGRSGMLVADPFSVAVTRSMARWPMAWKSCRTVVSAGLR
jgi:hypothetical protein